MESNNGPKLHSYLTALQPGQTSLMSFNITYSSVLSWNVQNHSEPGSWHVAANWCELLGRSLCSLCPNPELNQMELAILPLTGLNISKLHMVQLF